MYVQNKVWEKAQALKNVFSDTCWMIFSCARKETAGKTGESLQDKQIQTNAIAFVWSVRDACVFSTHFISHRVGSHLLERC